ncbi:MAG: AAA family ATPase [Acidobacteriota bacterium]
MEIILTIGIQATGKSTFVRSRFLDTHVIVSLDVVRTRRREEAVVRACLGAGQRVVVDNTNVSRDERRRYFEWAEDTKFKVNGYYFQSRIDDALARNRTRSGRKCVPDKGVLAAARRLEVPSVDEGFSELHYVSLHGDDFRVSAWDPEALGHAL